MFDEVVKSPLQCLNFIFQFIEIMFSCNQVQPARYPKIITKISPGREYYLLPFRVFLCRFKSKGSPYNAVSLSGFSYGRLYLINSKKRLFVNGMPFGCKMFLGSAEQKFKIEILFMN